MSAVPPVPYGTPSVEPTDRSGKRWRLVGFSFLIAMLYVTVTTVIGWNLSFAALRRLTNKESDGTSPADVANAFRSFQIAVDVACGVLAVGLMLGALQMWRRRSRGLGWGFLIALPLTVLAAFPVGAVSLAAIAATSALHGDTSDSPGLGQPSGVEIVNDLSRQESVTYCPKQLCTSGWTVALAPGQTHRSGKPSGPDIPDEIRVNDAPPRCGIVVGENRRTAVVDLSQTDPRGC